METRLAVTLFWFRLHCFSHVNRVVLNLLTTPHLHEKEKEVCIKTCKGHLQPRFHWKARSMNNNWKMGYYHTTQWLFHHTVNIAHVPLLPVLPATDMATVPPHYIIPLGHCSMAFPPHNIIPLTHCSSTLHHTTWPLFITFSPHYMYIVP